jgi:hypothetical protein
MSTWDEPSLPGIPRAKPKAECAPDVVELDRPEGDDPEMDAPRLPEVDG